MENQAIMRIIDVNINRASEGLRVLEEISRFVLNNKKITKLLREVRAKLINPLKYGDYSSLIVKNRDIKKDFGKKFISKKRKDLYEIVKANAKRAQEALRVLEEFSFDKNIFSKLRFKVYDLEKSITEDLNHKCFIDSNRIDLCVYVVHDKVEILIESIKKGAKLVQLRDKISSAKEILKKAKKIKKFIEKLPYRKRPFFIINDRVDITLLSGADGVHLGQDDISVKEAKTILGVGKIVGKTTHNIIQGIKAQNEGATYISVGPVYSTPTKPNRPAVGLKYVKLAAKKIKIPWVAIGDINKETAENVIKAGARNIAVVRAYKEIPYLIRLLNKYYKRN